MLQGEMGPDGIKGDRGEPGMTVSGWSLPQALHTLIHSWEDKCWCCFALFSCLFWIQEDEVREYVRSEMNQHCGESFIQPRWLIFYVALSFKVLIVKISLFLQRVVEVLLKRNWLQAQKFSDSQNWQCSAFLFAFPGPCVCSSACGGKWAIWVQQKSINGQKGCYWAWVTILYHTHDLTLRRVQQYEFVNIAVHNPFFCTSLDWNSSHVQRNRVISLSFSLTKKWHISKTWGLFICFVRFFIFSSKMHLFFNKNPKWAVLLCQKCQKC